MSQGFDTPIEERDGELCGPLRAPRQMLADQEYGGHESIHDDDMAEKLGFRAGPIEGPTHFSQFVPLCERLWGQEWYETGCLSAHYRNMVVEGESVRAFVSVPENGATQVRIRAEKEDGTEVLIGTASVGHDNPPSEIEARMARLNPPEQLVILRDLEVGQKGAQPEHVSMGFDQHMGNLYPFSLNQKLAVITENSPWYAEAIGESSPWGRAIVPLEMISVLGEYSSHQAGFKTRGPAIGLFAGQQIRMLGGPLFVGEELVLEREVALLTESRRTESNWVKTTFLRDGEPVAEMILNHATLKDSYEPYEKELAELTA